MELSVSEFAEAVGLSERRVRALIEAGRIEARESGARYLIPEQELLKPRLATRPMTAENAWLLARFASSDDSSWLAVYLRHRFADQIEKVISTPDPALLLASWLANRADRKSLSTDPAAARALLNDPRVTPSGISDPRSKLSSGAEAECYVRPQDVDAVTAEYLLAPGERRNVWLHVTPNAPARGEMPVLVVAADLAEHGTPREKAAAKELIASLAR